MSIHLERKDLTNAQQMEVAVSGPDGATHLILCTGIVQLDCLSHGAYTFLVGPQLSRRQFVSAIASCGLSTVQGFDKCSAEVRADLELGARLISIDANYDDEARQVKVKAEVSSSSSMTKLAISYQVNILAELPSF